MKSGKKDQVKILKGILLKNNLDARLLNFLSYAKVPSTKLLALENDASKWNYYRSKI